DLWQRIRGQRPAAGLRANTGDEKSAAARLLLSNDVKPGGRLFRLFDDYVLQQFAEAGFHGAFVASLHFQIIGNRSALSDLAISRGQERAGRITIRRAARVKFLERLQPRFQTGELMLA